MNAVYMVLAMLGTGCLAMGAEKELNVLAIPMEEGADTTMVVHNDNPVLESSTLRNGHWIVEFESISLAEKLALRKKDSKVSGSFQQLSSRQSSGVESRTDQHADFRDDLFRLAGSAQLGGQVNPDHKGAGQPEITHEYAVVFWGASVKMSDELRAEVSKLPYVHRVVPDSRVQVVDDASNEIIGAPEAWNTLGLTGEGVVIAVVDTGIDESHPAFSGKTFLPGIDLVQNDADPFDDHGHGTHCAGIAAANGGELVGVAPEAALMAVKVLSGQGFGFLSDVIAGIEYAVDPDDDPDTDDGADVISLSLGGLGDPDDPVSQAVDGATELGVLCVVAAGNSGTNYSIGSPGCARSALTVGATYGTDYIAGFSSRGPTSEETLLKPDLVAPGSGIYSSLPGGAYGSMDGTSMATPHVSGAAALLLQAYSDRSPEEIKAMLVQTSRNLDASVFDQGGGLMDIPQAYSADSAVYPVSLTCGFVDSSIPVFEVERTIRVYNFSDTTQLYSLETSLPEGVTLESVPEELEIEADSYVDVTFRILIDNSILPYTTDGLPFVGHLFLNSSTTELDVPILAYKSQYITLEFSDIPWVVYVHDGGDVGKFIREPGRTTKVLLTPGNFDIITLFEDGRTFHVSESVEVPDNGEHPVVIIDRVECTKEFSLGFVDENGEEAIPAYMQHGSLLCGDPDTEEGILIFGKCIEELRTNPNDYVYELSNSFVTEEKILHSHTLRLSGYDEGGVYLNDVDDTKSVEMHWDGDGHEAAIAQAVNTTIFKNWALYSHYMFDYERESLILKPPLDFKFIGSGHPLFNSPMGTKRLLVLARDQIGREITALGSTLFDLTENDFRVMGNRELQLARFPRVGPSIRLGGSPTFFSGRLDAEQNTGINLRSFDLAPAFFIHPGHSMAPQLDQSHASVSHYVIERDEVVIDEGDILQSDVFWNNGHLSLDGAGQYRFTLSHEWEQDDTMYSNSMLIAEFDGGIWFEPFTPSGIYLMNQTGRQVTRTTSGTDQLFVQIHFPIGIEEYGERGVPKLYLNKDDEEIELFLSEIEPSVLEATLPTPLAQGDYSLKLRIEYPNGQSLCWMIDPVLVVLPFDVKLSTDYIEDHLDIGTEVATLLVSGPIADYWFELIHGQGDEHNDYFILDGNRVLIAQDFDYFDNPLLRLRVRTSDGETATENALLLKTRMRDFEVAIPDPQLLESIRKETGKPEGSILRSELATIDTLDTTGVLDWSGLEYTTGIETLIIDEGSQVPSQMQLRRLVKLQCVDLRYATIENLHWIVDIPYLSVLTFYKSTVEEWSLPPLTLDYLDFNVSNCNLESLLQLGDPQMIHDIRIEECPLRTLEGIEAFEELNVLGLWKQELESIQDLMHVPSLRYLILSPNMIPNDELEVLSNLNLFMLSLVDFREVEHAKYVPRSLQELELMRGELSNLDFLNEMESLRFLSIVSSGLKNLTSLECLKNLESLSLQNNELFDISSVAGLSSLRNINLRENNLMDISPLAELLRLQSVDISVNFFDLQESSSQMALIRDLESRGVQVEYSQQKEIIVEGGHNQKVIANRDGFAEIALDATSSYGPFTEYYWSWGSGFVEGEQVDVSLPIGKTFLTFQAMDVLGGVYTDTFEIEVYPYFRMPESGPTFSQWMKLHYRSLSEEERAPFADVDGDGFVNLQEYAFGLNPIQADSPGIMVLKPDSIGVEATFNFRANDPKIELDLFFAMESLNWLNVPISFNLETWQWETSVDNVLIEGAYIDGGLWKLKVRQPFGQRSAFMKIELQYPAQ